MTLKDIGLALIIVLLWGFNFIFIKFGLQEMSPSLYGALRFTVSMLPILFIKKPDVSWKYIIGIGISLNFAKFAFLFSAIHYGLSAGIASMALQMQVFFSVILSFFVFGTRPTPQQGAGMLIAFFGMFLISNSLGGTHGTPLGILLIILAAVCWSISSMFYKKANCNSMFALNSWSSIIAPIPFLGLSLLLDPPGTILNTIINLSWKGWTCVLYAGVASTMIGATLWGYLIQKYDPTKVSPYALLIPIVGMSSCWFVYGECMTIDIFLGALIVFIGLAINQLPIPWHKFKKTKQASILPLGMEQQPQ